MRYRVFGSLSLKLFRASEGCSVIAHSSLLEMPTPCQLMTKYSAGQLVCACANTEDFRKKRGHRP